MSVATATTGGGSSWEDMSWTTVQLQRCRARPGLKMIEYVLDDHRLGGGQMRLTSVAAMEERSGMSWSPSLSSRLYVEGERERG